MAANTYTVRTVDLSDKARFLTSEYIVEYAGERGWCDPRRDGPSDFAAAYANPNSASNPSNFGRQRSGLNYVADRQIAIGPALPFSVAPKGKIGPAEQPVIARVLTGMDKIIIHSSTPGTLGNLTDEKQRIYRIVGNSIYVL